MPFLLFFIETKIGRTIAITGIIIIAVATSWIVFKTHYYNEGWASAIHAIAAKDEKAIKEKDDALATTRACRARGGTWDVPNRVCQ